VTALCDDLVVFMVLRFASGLFACVTVGTWPLLFSVCCGYMC